MNPEREALRGKLATTESRTSFYRSHRVASPRCTRNMTTASRRYARNAKRSRAHLMCCSLAARGQAGCLAVGPAMAGRASLGVRVATAKSAGPLACCCSLLSPASALGAAKCLHTGRVCRCVATPTRHPLRAGKVRLAQECRAAHKVKMGNIGLRVVYLKFADLLT